MSSMEQDRDDKTKEERLLDYVRSMEEVDKQMEPFKEHRRAIKENYKENKWLTKDEMSTAMRAYRMLKKDESIDDIVEIYDVLKGKFR